MMKANPFIPEQKGTISHYYFLSGLNRSRGRAFMEARENQSLWTLMNGYVNQGGEVVRDPAVRKVGTTTERIASLRFFNTGEAVWAEEYDEYISLRSSRGHVRPEAYDAGTIVTFAYFRGRLLAMAGGYPMVKYDGAAFTQSRSTVTPAFGVAVQGRLAVAGFPDKPSEVWFSRALDEDTFLSEEDSNSSAVTRAAFLDISSITGTAAPITGLASFEASRIAIFTADQAVIYVVDPDFSKWELDQRANVRVGCVSHRTIQQVGADLVFCSRHGVHFLRRSIENGISIVADVLSQSINEMYRRLVASVPDPRQISAVYDQELGHYHIFFPQPGGVVTHRLTLDVSRGYEDLTWSQGNTLYARCGDSLAGTTWLGTHGGIYEILSTYLTPAELAELGAHRGDLTIEFPILWHGDTEETKYSHELIIHASGQGTLILEIYDEEGALLQTRSIEVSPTDDGSDQIADTPLSSQYMVPLELAYRGVSPVLRMSGLGDFRLLGLRFGLRKR